MNGQRGLALAVALLAIALTLTAGAAFLVMAAQNARQDEAAYRAERAYHAADGGLSLALAICSSGEYACLNWSGWDKTYPVDKDAVGGPVFRLTRSAATVDHAGTTCVVTVAASESLPEAMGGSGQARRVLQARLRFDTTGAWTGVTLLGSP